MMYFRKFTKDDLKLLKLWQKDHLVQKYVHHAPLEVWFNYMNENPKYFSWIVYDKEFPDIAVGMVDVEEYEPDIGAICIITNPKLRRKGYGTRMVKEVIQLPEIAHLKKIEAFIEPDNISGLKCFQKANFIKRGMKDGFYEYVYEK